MREVARPISCSSCFSVCPEVSASLSASRFSASSLSRRTTNSAISRDSRATFASCSRSVFSRSLTWRATSRNSRFIHSKRKTCLAIVGMDQERGAPINIGAQHVQALISRVPRFYDDVIQLIAQEVFYNVLVLLVDFQKICQHSRRRHSALQGARA